MKTLTIGIDNGISGGIAFLRDGNEVALVLEMPIQARHKGNEIDVLTLRDQLLESVAKYGHSKKPQDITVVLEEPGGSKSYKAAVSMASSYTAIRTVCRLMDFRVISITPTSWQKALLKLKKKSRKKKEELEAAAADPAEKKNKGYDNTENKAIALTKARELWPTVDWRANTDPGSKCKVAHTGKVDAALIAYHGFTERL